MNTKQKIVFVICGILSMLSFTLAIILPQPISDVLFVCGIVYVLFTIPVMSEKQNVKLSTDTEATIPDHYS